MYKSEKLDEIENKVEELEKKLEVKNAELENLQRRFNEVEVESRVEEVMLSTQKKNHKELAGLKSEMTIQIADLQNQCKEEVKKEVDNVLPTAVEQGLRDLPFEMVCAFEDHWYGVGVVSYDRITVEFNNSDRPGGGDGSMNIETGVFTIFTSGYYIITVGGIARVPAGETTQQVLLIKSNECIFDAIKILMYILVLGFNQRQHGNTELQTLHFSCILKVICL